VFFAKRLIVEPETDAVTGDEPFVFNMFAKALAIVAAELPCWYGAAAWKQLTFIHTVPESYTAGWGPLPPVNVAVSGVVLKEGEGKWFGS
jgi:hypothetical protein